MYLRLCIALLLLMQSSHAESKECVILLHGLIRSSASMSKIETALNKAGYHTINQGYPSTQDNIETLAEEAISNALVKSPTDATRIHFVTHSMGGILVRNYLDEHSIENLGRVVMLGPPNKGSQVVDKLKGLYCFKMINGEAGMQLGTDKKSVPNQLGPSDFEVGIIAGTRSMNLILSTMLPGKDDGKVTVENTKLEGMKDHIALPVTHPFMMRNKKVIQQVIHFLENGEFDRKD